MGRKSLKTPRQKEIIKAFYTLAKKEGLENASIAKTAALININPSLVIHYFRTKEYLMIAFRTVAIRLLFVIKSSGKSTKSYWTNYART